MPPPQIIEGVLHQGCKMVLSGASKSNESSCLLDLAVSVASGQNWCDAGPGDFWHRLQTAGAPGLVFPIAAGISKAYARWHPAKQKLDG